MIRRFALAAALALSCVPLYATTYTLEPDYTQGVFRWNHLGFSSPAGQFSQGQGTLEFDPAAPAKSAVSVTIPLSTLSTGVPDLDEDFRSSAFFDVASFPTATFKSTRAELGRSPQELEVTGDLSLHGVTKPITLRVAVIKIGTNPRTGLPTIGFDATTMLKRSDFGLGRYVPQVGDEIEMRIITQGVEAKSYAAYLEAQEAKKAGESTKKAGESAKKLGDSAKK